MVSSSAMIIRVGIAFFPSWGALHPTIRARYCWPLHFTIHLLAPVGLHANGGAKRCAARSLFKHAILRYLSAGKLFQITVDKHSITYTRATASARYPGRGSHLFFAVAALPITPRLAILLVEVVVLAFDALFHIWRISWAVRIRIRVTLWRISVRCRYGPAGRRSEAARHKVKAGQDNQQDNQCEQE